jgi:hypothetical protein
MALPTNALDLAQALEQAAKAIGIAGRTLAEHSAGVFAALSVTSVRPDVHFDPSVTADSKARTVGLVFRTGLFGPTVATATDRVESGNRGSFTPDIVALLAETLAASPPQPAPEDLPDPLAGGAAKWVPVVPEGALSAGGRGGR